MEPAELTIQNSAPSTFMERGVAVPFTTPQLTGARLRPGQRHGLEVVIPNPAGTRSTYVLPTEMLDGYCRMTVHDRALHNLIVACRVVTPASIRAASRDVAGDGLAGRAAAAAASAAKRTEEHARLLMNFNLMLELIRRMELPGVPAPRLDIGNAEEVERRARDAVSRLVPEFGCTASRIHDALEEVATDILRVGHGAGADEAALPQALRRINALREAVVSLTHPANRPGADLARLLVDVADATLQLAHETLDEARAVTCNVVDLLRMRCADPVALAELLARPEWLLDGWDQVCLAWQEHDPLSPPEMLLAEMVGLLPLLPREAARWGKLSLDFDAMEHRSRTISLNHDWRTAKPVFDLVARNEHRLALAA